MPRDKILRKEDDPSFSLRFDINVESPTVFYRAVEENCPRLATAIRATPSDRTIIFIKKGPVLRFISTGSQEEEWRIPFEYFGSPVGKYGARKPGIWKVSDLRLSADLLRLIGSLSEAETRDVGVFNIKKGNCDICNVFIKVPVFGDNAYEKSSNLTTNNGIYGSFLDLEDMYGLEIVRFVTVKLISNAVFSRTGASVVQREIVD